MDKNRLTGTFSQALVAGLPFAPWDAPDRSELRIVPGVPVYPHVPLPYVLLRLV